ncbi:S-adenosyl-L-methionine-dependent methyltransferase [Gonapodya prolifera JEL478]|uniref:S-adenosyl-L-methionine-dependent methyltransferase n=1 Tax=Gonapodya prolifera (strain JEL478) TaxID=1344416 RepID=A0A139AYJ6_GONPJ|nr:S-adenosyl-L-methionine-dependent methyltransferase [Gonapodya prolifera JEL478]|eukprot:KXS21799.1 S-adenosyl-L-methionine-dependent methyltransferase [Gonapodya prolifera JEL478]
MSAFRAPTFAADAYAKSRPTYTSNLYNLVIDFHAAKFPKNGGQPASTAAAKATPGWNRVVDLGCGTGQATIPLSRHFATALGVDPSEKMLSSAARADNVSYSVGSEKSVPVEDHSVDLVTAAQCAHWFDVEAFVREARRILRPNGTIAIWGYALAHVRNNAHLTQVLRDTAYGRGEGQVGPYWEPGREILENRYESVTFPFREQKRIHFPSPTHGTLIDLDLPLPAFKSYVRTWSAYNGWVHDPKNAGKPDPADTLVAEFERVLGGPDKMVEIDWQGVLILATVD